MPKGHFDIIAPFYDHSLGKNTSSKWTRNVSPAPGWRILDAGGGTGRMSSQLIGSGVMICVADISMGMLKQAGLKPGLHSVLSCTESLAYADDCFDFILMTDAYHHVADQKLTLQELWRVLKPGGKIMMEEPDIHYFGVKIVAVIEKLLLMRSHFESPEKIVQRFEALGGQVHTEMDGYSAFIWVSKPAIG